MSSTTDRDGASTQILDIGVRRDRDEYVIALTGELDLSEVKRMSQVFCTALDSDARGIVLDLSGLEFLDSTGVHTILRAERSASERSRDFVIVRGPRQVQRIFEISGIADRLVFSDG